MTPDPGSVKEGIRQSNGSLVGTRSAYVHGLAVGDGQWCRYAHDVTHARLDWGNYGGLTGEC